MENHIYWSIAEDLLHSEDLRYMRGGYLMIYDVDVTIL